MKIPYLAALVAGGVLISACTPGGVTTSATPSPEAINQTDTETMMLDVSPAPTDDAMMGNANADTDTMRTVVLDDQNNSGQTGTATLEENDNGQVVVTISTTLPSAMTAAQPAHIHVGSCPNPGAVQYPLTSLVGGKSVTTLNVTMEQLLASSENLAVNIHKSAQESSVYTACGDIQ